MISIKICLSMYAATEDLISYSHPFIKTGPLGERDMLKKYRKTEAGLGHIFPLILPNMMQNEDVRE